MLEMAEPLNVVLGARDLEASKRFYAEQLGLSLWREEPHQALHFGVGGVLLTIRKAAEAELPPRGARLQFAVRDGLDELVTELQSRGVRFDQTPANGLAGRAAIFHDPDGHELWILQPSDAETQFSRWRTTRRLRTRPIPLQRRPQVRRHERPPVSRRQTHPTE